ncbi:MAG: hypothetical protein NVS2B17_29840 [Candidatus Velthaea sp.]
MLKSVPAGSSSTEFLRHGLIVFASSVIVNGLNYVFHILNSRQLGVVHYGELSTLISVLMIALIPAGIGSLAVTKFAAEFHALDDGPKLRTLSMRVLWWSLIASSAIVLAGAVAGGGVASFLALPEVTAVYLTAALIACNTAVLVMRGILQGAQNFRAFAISNSLEAILKAVFGVGLVYAGYGITGALAGMVAGCLIATAYTVVAVVRQLDPSSAPLHIDFRRLLQTMLGTLVAASAFPILAFADIIAVKHYLDAEQSGLYGAMTLWGKIIWFAVSFIPTIVLPKASARASKGQSVTSVLAQAGIAGGVLSLVGVTICAVAPAFVIRAVAGPAFISVAPLLLPYAIGISLLGLANVAVTFKIGIHRFDYVVPLCIAVIAELIGFVMFHRSAADIVHVVVFVDIVTFAISLWRIATPRLRFADGVQSAA